MCACGQELQTFEEHTHPVIAVAISVDGDKIVTGSVDKTVRVSSLESGEVYLPACLLACLIMDIWVNTSAY